MIRTTHLLMLGVAALVFAGCPSVSNLTSARTLDKGNLEVTVAPTFMNATFFETDADGNTSGAGTTLPSVEGQLRYGITDNVELGAKLSVGGFAGHLKFGLLRSETAEDGFNLSLDPGVSFMGFGVGGGLAGIVYVYLPVLAGYRFGGHEITFGPRLVPQFAIAGGGGSSSGGMNLLGGGSAAVSFRLGESFRLTPEISVLAPLDSATRPTTGMLAQFSLGFSFGTN